MVNTFVLAEEDPCPSFTCSFKETPRWAQVCQQIVQKY